MISLHYHPGNASFAPHVLLLELGIPFELLLVDRSVNAHKSTAYLQLNPNGQIPVLQDGDTVVYETAAILMHLADRFPQAGLAPALGSIERATYYQWGLWLSNTLQAMLMHYFYPERMFADGDHAGAARLKAVVEARVVPMLQILDTQLAASGGQASTGGGWLLGQHYCALDPLAFMLCRWTRGFVTRPARDFEHLAAYLQRMLERRAVRQAFAAEGLSAPWF